MLRSASGRNSLLRGLAAASRTLATATPAAEDPLKTVVILGSTRKKRIGASIGKWMVQELEERGGHDITVLDPRETHDGFFLSLMEKAFFHYKEGEDIPAPLLETAEILRSADCYLVVSPEYNHTLPPGLTNLMNYFGSKVRGSNCKCVLPPK